MGDEGQIGIRGGRKGGEVGNEGEIGIGRGWVGKGQRWEMRDR